MKRALDLLVAGTLLVLLALPLGLIALAVRLSSPGPVIYWSWRLGRDGKRFLMPKFRSMRVGTPLLATQQLAQPDRYVTRVGRFLRRASLDELPQLYSILIGDMSLVGPRPALVTEHALVVARRACGIERLRPGLTGWAQVNGRDHLSLAQKLRFDQEYLERASIGFDLRIMARTCWTVLRRDGIAH